MSGENNPKILLQNMDPVLADEAFVFLTSVQEISSKDRQKALMIFRESEGETFLVSEAVAREMGQQYDGLWAQITLTIHSDLNAVGFLAAILPPLAAQGISVNPVSAYFHDHLFVPWKKRTLALEILQEIKRS